MNANERFEYMAEQFYRKTGMLAPGKDDAIHRSDEYKRKVSCAWGIFTESFYSSLFQTHSDMYEMLEKVNQTKHETHCEIERSNMLCDLCDDIESLLKRARG